jgi:hypothetical protein
MAPRREGLSQDTVTAAGWNHPKLLDVDVHQLA